MSAKERRQVVVHQGVEVTSNRSPQAGRELAGHLSRSRLGAGGVIVVAGPDGAGKSSLCDALIRQFLPEVPIKRVHHRPGMLPYSRRTKGPITEPHAEKPYGAAVSVLKIFYVFCDFLVGWPLRIRPFGRRHGWVILERGWWDLAVDPRRYRLPERARLIRFLGRFLPQPDLTLVLEAPVEVLLQRKRELPAGELLRQMRAWRSSLPGGARRVFLDASRPIDELVRSVELELQGPPVGRPDGRAPERWVRLPSGRPPRWLLIPRAPRRASVSSLRLFHPVTLKGRVGWKLAKAGATLGAFRLLPVEDRLPEEVGPLLGHVPLGGTVALAKANHPARYVALILDERGDPHAMAKIAVDGRSRRALEREREALARFGPLLPPPLSPPFVLDGPEGIHLMRVADWRPRPYPWRLPEDVAFALGRFFCAGPHGVDDGSGLAHGDFAPWNLLRTDNWVLLDWEEAGDRYPPFFDLFHYVVQAHALLGRPSLPVIAGGLKGRGWIGNAIRAYAEGAGLDQKEARAWFRPYLLESGRRLHQAGPGDGEALRARDRLLKVATR